MGGMSSSHYTFAGVDRAPELERLRRIESIFDPGSRALLEAAGLPIGGRCLEVGAGAGSIAAWLAGRVGTHGEVIAVDLDTSFLRASSIPAGVRVIEGDVCHAGLPSEHFDVVHARYVLVHNAKWQELLDTLIAALKPGGALVLEEPDFTAAKAAAGDDHEDFDRVSAAVCAMFRSGQKDPAMGIRLPSAVEARGVEVERVVNFAPLSRGRDPVAAMMALSATQLRAKYLATGLVDEAELDGYLRFANDPRAWGIYYATLGVAARK
jgi:SAM-dependent methyltransferase